MWARSKPSDSSPGGRPRKTTATLARAASATASAASSSSTRVRADPEAGGEGDLHAVGRRGAQLVEGDVDAGSG